MHVNVYRDLSAHVIILQACESFHYKSFSSSLGERREGFCRIISSTDLFSVGHLLFFCFSNLQFFFPHRDNVFRIHICHLVNSVFGLCRWLLTHLLRIRADWAE